MKLLFSFCILLSLIACSEGDVEEFTFRETLKYTLTKTCTENDKGCKDAVDTQTQPCMEKSDWRKLLSDKENKKEKSRFKKEFYSCLVDAQGKPYFVVAE